jgi:hypothetical protein
VIRTRTALFPGLGGLNYRDEDHDALGDCGCRFGGANVFLRSSQPRLWRRAVVRGEKRRRRRLLGLRIPLDRRMRAKRGGWRSRLLQHQPGVAGPGYARSSGTPEASKTAGARALTRKIAEKSRSGIIVSQRIFHIGAAALTLPPDLAGHNLSVTM